MCMIDDCDGYAVLLHSRAQKARLEHRCSECRRTIGVGEVYTAERVVFDGSASSYKTCAHCIVARQFLSVECSGFAYTAVAEDILEHGPIDKRWRLLSEGLKARWHRSDGRLWPLPQVLNGAPAAEVSA